MSSIETAERLYEEGEYFGSFGLVQEILESEPDNLKALELKANLFYATSRLSEAIPIYKKLLRFYGSNKMIWEQLYALNSITRSYWVLGNFDKAVSHCERSVELCERFLKFDGPHKESFADKLSELLWVLGGYQCESKKYSPAIGTYKKLLGLLSEFGCLETIADALYELAYAYYKLNRTDEALSKYSEALKIYEVLGDELYAFYCRSRIHYYLGSIRFAARDFKEALSHLEKSALLMEKAHGEIKGEGDIEDNFFYKRTKRLLNSLEKNKFLWKKK